MHFMRQWQEHVSLSIPLAVGGFVVSAPTVVEPMLYETLVIEVVTGGSSSTLSFVWKKDGVRLTDSDRIQGVGISSLSISAVALGDIGLYECIPSNQNGSFNSSITQVNIRSKPAVNIGRKTVKCMIPVHASWQSLLLQFERQLTWKNLQYSQSCQL